MDWLNLAKAAVLGVVQGLTEFLPISSTAHLLLGERILRFADPDGAFTVMIQLGSILAVMWIYRAKIWDTIIGLPSKPQARRFALMLIIAFLPALLIGFFAADYVKAVLYNSFRVIAFAFIFGGLAMLALERWRPQPTIAAAEATPLLRALGIGVFQTLALVPGVSRSGATILGGLTLGLERHAAAEFSFFLAMPTMTAAFSHDFLDLYKTISADRAAEISVGFITAFVAALLVVKPFLRIVTRAGYAPFAWYRIGLGACLLGAVQFGYI